MPVKESKRWMLRRELVKEFPVAKHALPHIRVMKQHGGVFGKFRAPNQKIIFDVIIDVATVNVERSTDP
jgi:hypothetical protein